MNLIKLLTHLTKGKQKRKKKKEKRKKKKERKKKKRKAGKGNSYKIKIRMAPREIYGISFQFHRDFDQQGILFYIGTNSGTEPWKNPALTGRVKVTASSMEKGQASYITDYKEPHECWTKDIPASWFQLDLGPNRRVLPNYYTIRHGGNYKADRFFFSFSLFS